MKEFHPTENLGHALQFSKISIEDMYNSSELEGMFRDSDNAGTSVSDNPWVDIEEFSNEDLEEENDRNESDQVTKVECRMSLMHNLLSYRSELWWDIDGMYASEAVERVAVDHDFWRTYPGPYEINKKIDKAITALFSEDWDKGEEVAAEVEEKESLQETVGEVESGCPAKLRHHKKPKNLSKDTRGYSCRDRSYGKRGNNTLYKTRKRRRPGIQFFLACLMKKEDAGSEDFLNACAEYEK